MNWGRLFYLVAGNRTTESKENMDVNDKSRS
jgi:hypothetical protein